MTPPPLLVSTITRRQTRLCRFAISEPPCWSVSREPDGCYFLMISPPGTGKSMLAKRLATIMPAMTESEAIETTKIHSVAGLIDSRHSFIATRPFRSPHHTISDAGQSTVTTNSAMPSKLVRQHCQLEVESHALLEQAMNDLNFSARAHDRILKVSRTLADLDGEKQIQARHLLEAIQYRSLDRNLWA